MCVCVSKQNINISHDQPLSDLVELLWVADNDLDSHLHFGFLETEVQASNLGVNNALYHAFGKNRKQHV